MRALFSFGLAGLLAVTTLEGRQIDYAELWAGATPFDSFLSNVKARQDDWRTRFSNASIEAGALSDARALPSRRRILAVAEDRCSDSAWAVPYLAKLAAAVPERLELRVIGRAAGRRVQSAHLTPDGRLATPTIVILDERDRVIGGWVERPAALQRWFIEKKASLDSDELHKQMDAWYREDDGRSTVKEVLAILAREPLEGKGF